MKFRSLIIKNIFRNKARSFLAVIGIAIGVAAVVGLGLVTDNLSESAQSALTAGAADFSVVNGTSSGNNGSENSGQKQVFISNGGQQFGGTIQFINQTTVAEIQQIHGVNKAVGVLRTMTSLNSSSSNDTTSESDTSGSGVITKGNFASLIGINSDDISMDDIVITNGSVYSNDQNEVIMGATEAQSLNKTVGDTVSISNTTFKIVGIYETGNFMDDRGIVMSLDKLQNLTGNAGQISLVLVKANDGINVNDLATTIGQKYKGELTTTTSLSGMKRMNNGLDVINSGSWAVSLLAILIGGIVVIVTMMKAVTERTREIGVLRATGWTKKRIMTMILGESLLLSLIAVVIGLIIGIGIVEIITTTHILRGVTPAFSAFLILKGIGVALLLGIAGGIYPAYRASRLAPTEALRYE